MITINRFTRLTLSYLSAACISATLLSATAVSSPYSKMLSFEKHSSKSQPSESLSSETTSQAQTKFAPTSIPTEPSVLTNAPTPSQSSINDVVSYYYGSEATPILAEYKLCTQIGSMGAERNQCIGEISTDSLVQGQAVYLWMNYLVPKGTQSELLLQYNHNGITRDASNLKVSGSLRFRTWKKIKLSRTGDWELPIYFEQSGQHTELDRITLNVKEQDFAGL